MGCYGRLLTDAGGGAGPNITLEGRKAPMSTTATVVVPGVPTSSIAQSRYGGYAAPSKMGCTVLAVVSLDDHNQRLIRHCDERWSVPSGFDDTHPRVAAATMCCAIERADNEPCIGDLLRSNIDGADVRSVLIERPLMGLRCPPPLQVSIRQRVISSTNQAVRHRLSLRFMDNIHYP